MEISLEKVSDSEATLFWSSSPQATAFNNPRLAKDFAHSIEWWVAKRGQMPFVMWPIALNFEGAVVIPPLSYYFGPMWSRELSEKSITSRLADTSNCYKVLVQHFVERYRSFEFELHPSIIDVRFFDWWNFGGPPDQRFSVGPKYSALIGDLTRLDDGALMSQMRKVRRQEIRRFEINSRFETIEGVPAYFFSEQRRKTIEAQGLVEDPNEAALSARLVALEDRGIAHTVGTRDRESGEIVGAALCLDGNNSTNLVYNVSQGEFRAQGVGAWTVFNALRKARGRGISNFDFNGANSPQRGDDKHSYGAHPILYFRVSYPASAYLPKLGDVSIE